MGHATQQRSRVGFLDMGISLLTLLTASAHIFLSTHPDESMRFRFLLNGLGYMALLAAYLLPQLIRFRQLVRWTLAGYAALTIILWFFLGSPAEGQIDPFDLTVKAIEVLLIVFLILDSRQSDHRDL